MLPYFFAAGHHHYARYISWHLREMQHIPEVAKKDFLDGAHVCRHADGAPAVSSDQFGEQPYIKQGKQAGGLKRISTNPEQVAVWISSFGICSHISSTMDSMYDSQDTSANVQATHKEEGDKRRVLEAADRKKIQEELQKHSHPLREQSESLYNIVNGKVAIDTDINVHEALQIGQDMHKQFVAALPNGFHKPIKKKVRTM